MYWTNHIHCLFVSRTPKQNTYKRSPSSIFFESNRTSVWFGLKRETKPKWYYFFFWNAGAVAGWNVNVSSPFPLQNAINICPNSSKKRNNKPKTIVFVFTITNQILRVWARLAKLNMLCIYFAFTLILFSFENLFFSSSCCCCCCFLLFFNCFFLFLSLSFFAFIIQSAQYVEIHNTYIYIFNPSFLFVFFVSFMQVIAFAYFTSIYIIIIFFFCSVAHTGNKIH